MILRPGKTADGAEVAMVLRHVVRAIRARWPRVEIIVHGDSHYGRVEAIAWCECNRVGYIFGLALIKVAARVTETVTRIKIALPSAYPYKESLTILAARTAKLPP